MLSQQHASLLYQHIQELFSSESEQRAVFIALRSLLRELYGYLTEQELQFFSTLFAKQAYLLDKYNLPEELRRHLNELRILSGRAARSRQFICTADDVHAALSILCDAITHFSGIAPPHEIEHTLRAKTIRFSQQLFRAPAERIPFMRALVTEIGEKEQVAQGTRCVLRCQTEDYGEIELSLWDKLATFGQLAWKGASIHVFDCKRYGSDEHHFATTQHSLLVLEPDVLLDVTAVAECFQPTGALPLLYLLQRFHTSPPTRAMLIGSVVNYCLDEVLAHPDIDFEQMFAQALRSKPLMTLAAIADADDANTAIQEIAAIAREQTERLRETVTSLEYSSATTEPSFLSPIYGLQGRLDIMLEYEQDPSRKTVVELKSGSAPAPGYGYATGEKTVVASGIWSNHLAQVSCYNLLLDSAFQARTGDSQILYSKASEYPLRNAPNIPQLKQEVLMARNQIISAERQFIDRRFALLRRLHPEHLLVPSYKTAELQNFAYTYANITQQERLYLHAFLSFLVREQYSQRIGLDSSSSQGFASLWRDSLSEKNAQMSILAYLELDSESSDFENLHLRFHFSEQTAALSTFRVGDIVILYSAEQGEQSACKGQMIKAGIRAINATSVTISLRNKQLPRSYFTTRSNWVLEPDYIESSANNVYAGLFSFFQIAPQKRERFLGLAEPRVLSLESTPPLLGLSTEQQRLIHAALSAQDYFLLQGPPGTGKTSVMLKTLVEQLYANPNETILLAAFTNRAVDEICSALKRSASDLHFLRMGSKENTEHPDLLFTNRLHEKSLQEAHELMQSARIVVATVSFLHTNPELFTLKSFTTAIVDEASQILEPHLLGIISRVERCILIGDEKQLPAVVTQNERACMAKHPDLEAIGVVDLRQSLFERLLRLCMLKGWHHAYGMLSLQARMHKDIQYFPGREFYTGRLQPMNDWQHQPTQLPSPFTDAMVFIPSPREMHTKIHEWEAEHCAAIAEQIYHTAGESFSRHTLGIITPFRAQIREIHKRLTPALQQLVTVDTVERYQGSERDIILISCAVNHPYLLNSLQSLTEIDGSLIDRKLNVALTRARKQCIILGCEEILSAAYHYRRLIEYIAEKG